MEPTDAEIAARLRAILQSDEFSPRPDERLWSWLKEALERFTDWLARLGSVERTGIIVVCALVLVWIGVYSWQSVRLGTEPRAGTDGRAAGEEPPPSPESLLARARSLADEARLRDAARAVQQALFLKACRERNIPWQPSLSDWEWLQMLRAAEDFVDLTRTLQRLAFGPEPSRAEFDACVEQALAMMKKGHDAREAA